MLSRASLVSFVLGTSFVLAGCGGVTDGQGGGGTASGSFAFTNVTGTAPFSLTFEPTEGSISGTADTIPTWTGQATAQLTSPSSNLQQMDFQLFGALSVGSSFSLTSSGSTNMTFRDRADSTTDNDAYTATSGTVHVVAFDSSGMTLSFTNVTLVAGSAAPHPGSTATFNGTVTLTTAL